MATPSDPQCEGPTPSSSTSTLVGSTTDTRTPKRHHRQRSSVSVKKRASTQQAPALVAETADYFDTAAISPLGASPEQHAGLGLHGVEMEAHGRVSAPESRRGPRIDTKQLGVSLQDDAPAPSPTTRRELDFDAGTSETEGDEERAISSGSYPAGKAVSDGPALPSSSDNVRTPTSSELTQTTSAPKPSISEEQSGSSDSPPPLPAKDIGPISPPIPVKDAPSRTESPARMRLNGTPKSTLASPTHTSPLYQWTERPAPASPSSLSQTPRTSSLLLRTRAGSLLGSQASGSGEGRSGSGAAHANASSSPGRPGPGEVPSRIVPLRRNTGGALGPGTPTRGKRMSLSYIPSPSTSVGSPPVGSPPATSPSIASGASSYFPSRIDASSDVRAAHMRWPSLSRGSGSAGASTPSRLSLVQTPQSAPLGSGYFPPQQGTNDCPKSAGFAERARRPREDGETVMSTHRELLSSIAEKERRCLELREELQKQEAELKTLKATWQSAVARELAHEQRERIAASPTPRGPSSAERAHRASASTASSASFSSRSSLDRSRPESSDGRASIDSSRSNAALTPTDAAPSTPQAGSTPLPIPISPADALKGLAGKLPSGLGTQLNAFFEGLAVTPPERADHLGSNPMSSALDSGANGATSRMSLERETKPASAGLAVLEEEADALSDASDSGGANPQAHCRTPTQSAGARMSSSKEHTEAGCSSVDLKLGGDASTERPTAASKKLQTLKSVSNVEEEEGNTSQSASGAAAPSAARRAPNANASKRTSMFASFGNMPLPGGLQAKMDELQAQGAEGWASWSKRLANSEAVRGASALLARAERNLGNAMLLDEVHPQHGAGAGTSDGQDAVTSPGSTTSTGTQDANERERAVLRAIGTSPQLRSLRPSSMSLSRSGSGSSAGGKSPRTSRGATATFPRLTSSPQTASGANKSPDFWALDGGLAPYVPTTSGADSPGSSGSMTAASLEGALSGAGFFGMFAQAWKPEGSKDDRTWAHDSSTPNLTSNPMKPGQRRKEKDASHSRSTSAASANSNMTGVSGGGGHSRTRIAAQRATSPSTSLSTSTAPSATKSTTTATSTTTTASTLDVRRASLSSSSSAGNWDWDATDEDKTITLSKSAVLEADAGTDADAGALGRRMDKGDLQKPLVPERVENKSHNLGPRSPPSLTSTASSPTMVQKQEEGEEDEWGW